MAANIEPTDWQGGLLRVPEHINLALFGGRGAGRTTGALFISMRHCELHAERAHVLFLRQTLRSLREVEDSFQLLLAGGYGGGVRVNRQDHLFRLPSSATIEFAPLNDMEDMAKLQGRSFSLIVADEYGNFSPQQQKFVDQLRANLRAGEVPTRMVLLANPGGRAHSNIKQRFIDKLIPLRPTPMEDKTEWALIPANFDSNPHNPKSYADALFAAANKDKELFRAWAQGAWNIARGAMFGDVIDEAKQRARYADIPFAGKNPDGTFKRMPHVHSFLAADWGQSAPAVAFACHKLLVPVGPFPRNSLILSDEVSSADPDDFSAGRNWSLGRFGEAMGDMAERTGAHKLGCIDDARGLTPEDTLIKGLAAPPYLFSFVRPQKNRRSGWASVREMLTNSFERNGKPGMWVSEKCVGWWATVPILTRDPLNMEDVDTRAVDHWADATRYAATYEIRVASFNTPKQALAKHGISSPTAPTLY